MNYKDVPKSQQTYVLVTTAHRGVFFGKLIKRDNDAVILEDCRNCIRWSADVGGFLGLSKVGPIGSSIIGKTSPQCELLDVTSISQCTDEAIAKWTEVE